MAGMGMNKGRPILSALIDDMVVFYELFTFNNKIPGMPILGTVCNFDVFFTYSGHLAIRFRRLSSTVVVRENRFLGTNGRAPVELTREAEDRRQQIICPFEKIGNLVSFNYSLLCTVQYLFHSPMEFFLMAPIHRYYSLIEANRNSTR
jgi:hypothetical protein